VAEADLNQMVGTEALMEGKRALQICCHPHYSFLCPTRRHCSNLEDSQPIHWYDPVDPGGPVGPVVPVDPFDPVDELQIEVFPGALLKSP